MNNAEKIFADIKKLVAILDKLSQKYAEIYAFLDNAIAMCDGCGKWDFKNSMKTITPPFNGGTIYICLDCWNEFLRES